MSRIAWAQLMDVGIRQLGLAPDIFWGLTPAELMLIAGTDARAEALTRAGLTALSARFPDKIRQDAGNE